MKKPTLTDWLFDLAKNLGSKAGTAYLAYGSTHVLLQAFIPELSRIPSGVKDIDPSSTAGVLMHILGQLSKSANDTLNGWVAWALVLVFATFCSAYVAGEYFKTRKPKSKFARLAYAFAHRKVALGASVDFMFGKLVVPFAVICTIMFELSDHFTESQKYIALFESMVVVAFIIGAHAMTFFGQQSNGTVIYTVAGPKPDGNHHAVMLDWLAKAVANFPFVGNATVQTESTDGTISVVIPIRYHMENWSNVDATEFVAKLRNAEAAWTAKGYRTISCFIPKDIQKRVPIGLKKERNLNLA